MHTKRSDASSVARTMPLSMGHLNLTVLAALVLLAAACSPKLASLPQYVPAPAVRGATAGPAVTLHAASERTVRFLTHNGETIGDAPTQAISLPHLVLYRNGALTPPEERTLIVEISGLQVPPPGVTVSLELETQHWDPDSGTNVGALQTIPVWRASQWFGNTSTVTQTVGAAVFAHTFTATIRSGVETVATPTDYYRYHIRVTNADGSNAVTAPAFSAEYAFLVENQWRAPLSSVREESGGASPDGLSVYYCDMFPFQRSIDDHTSRLLRKDVPRYVQGELVPRMIDAYRTQSDGWGFSWHDAWTSWRGGEDAEWLSVALSDGRTWFHGPAPYRGDAQISIKVTGGENMNYDSLTDGLMSSFHHELFHNLQRSILVGYGGDGRVNGQDNAWSVFSEGTAVLASAVGQPFLQFDSGGSARDYVSNSNQFIVGAGDGGDLNTSYANLFPYRAALYWRFLFEKCGGDRDPAAGMQVIRRALAVLYSGDVVDIASSTALVENLPEIMDLALAGSSCPFQTHSESLIAFARAIYALRLDGGRCTEPGYPAGCGLYDPHHLYLSPSSDPITYAGTDLQYQGNIKSSFGMDFVDVVLDPAANGKTLKLAFQGAPGAAAVLNVEIWRIIDEEDGADPRVACGLASIPEKASTTSADGQLVYEIPVIDTSAYNRLALIITRLDAQESIDRLGTYTITLRL